MNTENVNKLKSSFYVVKVFSIYIFSIVKGKITEKRYIGIQIIA